MVSIFPYPPPHGLSKWTCFRFSHRGCAQSASEDYGLICGVDWGRIGFPRSLSDCFPGFSSWRVLDWGPQLLTNCGPEATLSSLLWFSPPWQLASAKTGKELSQPARRSPQSFISLIPDATSPQCCYIPQIQGKLLKGRTYGIVDNRKARIPWGLQHLTAYTQP